MPHPPCIIRPPRPYLPRLPPLEYPGHYEIRRVANGMSTSVRSGSAAFTSAPYKSKTRSAAITGGATNFADLVSKKQLAHFYDIRS